MEEKIRILFCPLDWGLGHATRCVPVINALLERDIEVMLAADGRSYLWLKNEFPQLKIIRFPSYPFSYPKRRGMAWNMLLSSPLIIRRIRTEKKEAKKIIEENNIDAVISDNRFGLSECGAFSVYISHQLRVRFPKALFFLQGILLSVHRRIIRSYDTCWVPDYKEGINLAGSLSHIRNLPDNVKYIGPLSRFRPIDTDHDSSPMLDGASRLLVILSGPEQQRSVFEQKIRAQLPLPGIETIMVLGKPGEEIRADENKSLVEMGSPTIDELQNLIYQSDMVLCRPGYSSLMDLSVMGKKAVFVPTPGQTEQEYLARRFMKEKLFYFEPQNKFDIQRMITKGLMYPGMRLARPERLLDKEIDNLLQILREK